MLTPEEHAERDRVRFRTRYALRNPRPLVRDPDVALEMSWTVAHDPDARDPETGELLCDWDAIPVAQPEDVRGDEPPVSKRVVTAKKAAKPGSERRSARYADAIVANTTDEVVAAEAGERNNVLNRAAFRVGRAVGAGLLDEHLAELLLTDAATRCGIPAREAATTIRSGLRAGTRHPLEVAR
jgi:hypothetical protein